MYIKLDSRTHERTPGWEKREREVAAQDSVYVILSKSRISVKGSVGEPTSLDRQVCITFVISGQVIYMK